MEIVDTVAELRAALDAERSAGRTVGLVPTMGYLHDGHTSLMKRSATDRDVTVSTIFVNPLQFAEDEDLDTYPRDLEGDAARADASGTDLLFTPSIEEMYPEPVRTNVSVDVGVGFMESASRPTHFDGVTTVVAKLFGIVGPCAAYFGEKDWQQLAVVRRMALDLSLPAAVVGCPTVREADGLAMSSRNAYLTEAQRAAAPALYRALREGVAAIEAGQVDASRIKDLMGAVIDAESEAQLDYSEVVDATLLTPLDQARGEVRLLVAARLGIPRLLDNLGVTVR